ncbi:MAG: flippase-like domain-containing protein [Ruminococcaceae bacterium]|nr:flippase-like domain-containing protein [Oscillospiraceae bacterium]
MSKKNTRINKKSFDKSNNWLWSIVFIVIAALSVVAIISQSKSFSLSSYIEYILDASKPGLIAAVLSMLCFILFEGLALLILCRAFGYKPGLWKGYIYSAADIYFSAITPSATGGQPASAFFMMKDGMDSMLTTAALLVNLCMYTVSIVVIGILTFIFGLGLFAEYSIFSKILVLGGFIFQIGLIIFFAMLIANERLLHKISSAILRLLAKIKLIKKTDEKQKKLNAYMEEYRKYTEIISVHKKTLFFVFLFNFIQRIAQIAVTMFTYMATTGASIKDSFKVILLQAYTTIGSYCVPIPGGIGIADYLMFDGFGNIMSEAEAVKLQLLSRTLSFYFCVLLCGVSVLIQYIIIKLRSKKVC